VHPMEIGGGRRPSGFVVVDPKGYGTDSALAKWVKRGTDFASTLPAKKPAARKPTRKPRAASPNQSTRRTRGSGN
jgi:hypothetical protein